MIMNWENCSRQRELSTQNPGSWRVPVLQLRTVGVEEQRGWSTRQMARG